MEIVFILVEPAVPENVGASARAIKTMGFCELKLVNPCDYTCDKALMLAHGSHDVLQNAKVFGSLKEALADIDFAIATSAKQRWVKQDIVSSEEIKQFVDAKADVVKRLAIVFGCEESGLSNEDVALCDSVTSIPIANPYPSLNLSQAVMVMAYCLSVKETTQTSPKELGIENHGYKPLRNRVINLLKTIGIGENSLVHGRVLERLSQITTEDVNLLHSITSKVEESIGRKDLNC